MKAARFKIVSLAYDDKNDGRGFALHATDVGEAVIRISEHESVQLAGALDCPGVVTIFGVPGAHGMQVSVRGTLGEVAEKLGL